MLTVDRSPTKAGDNAPGLVADASAGGVQGCVTSQTAPPDAPAEGEPPTAVERAYWAAMGLGCTFFINVSAASPSIMNGFV